MNLIAPNSLSERILSVLAESPFIGASDLSEAVMLKFNQQYTEQAIHKTLRKLQLDSIVVKSGTRYGLNMGWITSFVSLGQKIENSYYSLNTLKKFLPDPGQHFSWEFGSLLGMRNFWGHMVVVMLNSSKTNLLYSWNPHPWYYQLDPQAQTQVWKAISLSRASVYRMIGGTNWLDKEPAKQWGKKVKYAFGKCPYSDKQSLYFSCVDNYILEIKLTASMTRSIEECYRKTKSAENLIPSFISLVSSKTRIKVKLTHSSLKASKVKQNFEAHFKNTR